MKNVTKKKFNIGKSPKAGQNFKAAKKLQGVGGGKIVKDARLKIISKNRTKVKDAREKLVSIAKTTDARQKLEKIRNLKAGKLDVKTTNQGGITITKTIRGKLVLTTNKSGAKGGSPKKGPKSQSLATKAIGSLTKTVGRGGQISIKTKHQTGRAPQKTGIAPTRMTKAPPLKKITRTIKGEMSEAAKLDEELMNTHVDPVVLKRTIKQDIRSRDRSRSPLYSRGGEYIRSDSPLYSSRARMMESRRGGVYRRSRSPLDDDRFASRAVPRYHYDDPRREMEREDEMYRKRIMKQDEERTYSEMRTMADRFETSGGTTVSPLQGAKVIVANLHPNVSQEDIIELFGDIGALKRAKVPKPGFAEVVFVNKADAMKAVDIYHNRQLDGKAMKCNLVGGEVPASGGGGSIKLPASLQPKSYGASAVRAPPPELGAIHRALFNDKKKAIDRGGTKPLFTVTMPNKNK